MSSYIPHPASAPSQPFAQTNPFEFAREHTIRDDWALRLDPETDTPDRLRAGAFAIMSEGFGIKDPTGRVFSGAQQNALDPKEYFAKARACWDAGSLAPVQSEGWNEYHDAAEKGDRATMRRLARENIRGEDAGNDVAAAWDPAMSRIGLKDDLDMERELLSVRDVLTPEEIAIIEESGRARAEKTAQTEFASDTFDEDFYENASAFDFMFARNKDLRDEETKARHAEANSRLAEVYRRHADDIRDEQRLPAYERQLADENLWATVQGLRGAVSDDAWRVVEMAQTLAGPKTDKRVLDAFEKLTTTEQRSIAGVLHALHYGRDTTLVGDAFRSFWDTAAQTVGGSARAIADVFRRGVMDGEEYRDMVERRALLEQANSGRMKEWGYLGQSVVGAFSTIPYMAVAAIPYAGTAAIMASASDQFQTEAALNGVDVGSREFMLTNWAFSGAYAAVEKLQIVPFKPLKNVSRRQMYCEMFHSLRSALFVAGGVAGTTVSESVEEGIQGGIERVVEGWGLGHDQAKEFAAGFASDFVGSLGTMAIIGAVGAGVQHHRYRSGAFSPEEAISATARVADLESRIKGHPEDAAVPLGEFSREFGMLGKDWVNAGTYGTARVRALMRWGFTPEQATRIHGMFSEIWKGVSGDEDARSEFVGGNRVRSAAELLADTLGVQVEDGENGEKSVSFRIGRGRVKLRFNPADRIETAVDVNDRTQAADVVEILNRNEEATTGTRGTMTVDEWLALPEEVRREQTKGMTVQGGFKIDAPDGTSVGEDALRVLSGRVIETDVALPQTVFHESMHAVLRLLREEAADDPEARALQEELAKVYAPQAGIDETVNEEALADGYQTYLTSLTTAVEDTGVFARLKRWIAQLLGRATVARDSLRAAQSAQGRLFNLALTGDITPAMRKEEAARPEETSKPEEPGPSPAPSPAPSAARERLAALEAELAATPEGEVARRQRLENRIAAARRKVERENAAAGRYQITTAPSPAELAEAARQYDEVVARYTNQDGTRKPGWLKAPNGADTHLTERQWVQVRTPAFKAWFGDWENDPANASRVVDENGEPRVMWRGAPFDPLSQEPGKGVIAAERYFTPNEAYARRYEKGAGATRAYFLNVRRPFDVRDARDAARLMELRGGNDFHVGKTGALDWAEAPSAEEIEELWPGEYDGLVLDEGGDPTASGGVAYRGESVIPFAGGAQVKSATDNAGTFSGENPDIRYSISGIYTGTAADYDKPSLHYVGTGEGSQVYGWGLYGSNVRGVAEGYAAQSETNPEILDQQNRSAFDPTGDAVADEARKFLAIMYLAGADSVDKAVDMAVSRLRDAKKQAQADWLQEHRSEFRIGRRRNAIIYEQTFFTNRAPGDASFDFGQNALTTDEHLQALEEEMPEEFDRFQVKAASIPEEGISHVEAAELIKRLRGKPYTNKKTKITANLSSTGAGKLLSKDAVGKTIANGFTAKQHNAIASQIARLFEDAELAEDRPDRNGDPNIKSIKRFVHPLTIGEADAAAWITVKESTAHGHRIYSVEGIKIEALPPTVRRVLADNNSAGSAPTPPHSTSTAPGSQAKSSGRLQVAAKEAFDKIPKVPAVEEFESISEWDEKRKQHDDALNAWANDPNTPDLLQFVGDETKREDGSKIRAVKIVSRDPWYGKQWRTSDIFLIDGVPEAIGHANFNTKAEAVADAENYGNNTYDPSVRFQVASRVAPMTDDEVKRAVEMFGTTDDPNNAAYILPDGRWLDMDQMGEHWEISQAFDAAHKSDLNAKAEGDDQAAPYVESALAAGLVRTTGGVFKNGSLVETGIQFGMIPGAETVGHVERFLDAVRAKNPGLERITVDGLGLDGRWNRQYGADEADAAIRDIRQYAATGTEPRESLVARFHGGRYAVSSRPSPEFAMDGTIADSLPAHMREDGRRIIEEQAGTPAWMADPDGTPTYLSERDWLRREAERRKRSRSVSVRPNNAKQQPGEEAQNNLVAVHFVGMDQYFKMIDAGGKLIAPSMAVSDADSPRYWGAGVNWAEPDSGVVFVMKPEALDNADGNVDIFGDDAGTPMVQMLDDDNVTDPAKAVEALKDFRGGEIDNILQGFRTFKATKDDAMTLALALRMRKQPGYTDKMRRTVAQPYDIKTGDGLEKSAAEILKLGREYGSAAMSVMLEAGEKNLGKKEIQNRLAEKSVGRKPAEFAKAAQAILDVLDTIDQEPRGYLEAKVYRAVPLTDVAVAIVNEEDAGELVDDLETRGVQKVVVANSKAEVDAAIKQYAPRFQVASTAGAERLGIRNLADAEAMERSGADRTAIWREAGWWRGRDGEWRVEIPDFAIADRNFAHRLMTGTTTTLGDLLPPDSALFRAYPSLASLRVYEGRRMGVGVAGQWNGNSIEIAAGAMMDERTFRSVLAHEVQHVVQRIEGFAPGGSEETFAENVIDAESIRQRMFSPELSEEEYERLRRRLEEIEENALDGSVEVDGDVYEDEFDAYRHLAGEADARLVQKRLGMPPERRAARPPWEDYDVDEDRQIVRFSVGLVAEGLRRGREAPGLPGSVQVGAARAGAERAADSLSRTVNETLSAAGEAYRASVAWNGPAYSYKSFATAYAARDRILGIDRPDDDYRRLLETMGVRDYSVDDLKADAEKIRARGLGRNEATLQRLAGLAEQESMARTVESLMRGSLELGEDVGSSARRAYETYLARMRRTAKGRDYTDLTADLGFDLADLALAIDPEAFAPQPKPEGDATPPAAGSDAKSGAGADEDPEVAALLDGKAADFGLTEEQLRERIQERMEQRTQEIRERLERIRARLDEWRAKEALRKAKLAERQEAEGKSDAPADVPDAEMFDAEQNETEAGAKRLADYESECVEEMPDFKAFLEECRRDGLDLSDAAEFVAAVRIWSEDFIARETGADPENVLRDPVNLARYRATMMEFLHGMADAMLDPEDGAAAKTAERMMQEIPSDATVGEIDGRTRTIVGFIQRNGIRQTRKQLIRELRKGIKLEAIRGKKWDEMERDAGRKVTGEREAAARYLYRILTWSDGMIAKESARLHDIVAGREDAYRSAGADDAALKDLARTDREVHRAAEKLQALQMYGGLRKKSPAEIKLAARAIMSWLTEEREAHEKRWNDWHARLDALAQRAAKAASASAQDYTPEDPGYVGKLADELTATIRQRLEQLFVGGGADARAVIDEVMLLVYTGSERMRAETAAARRRTDEMLERCVQGTGRNVRQFLKDLDAPIPDELNRQLRTAEQPVRMTNGQALQLLASLEQVASYAGNIEANGRGAERVVGTDPDGNPITEPQTPHAELLRRYFADKPAMVRLLEGMREVYEERRGALSDTFRAVTGNPILAPDPLYAPVKMFRGSSEGFETQVRAWDPFGPALQPRVKNTLDFDLSASIMDVYNNRTRETCRAIAWGIPGMELRSVLCRKEVQDAIARTHGKVPLRQLVAHLTDLVSDGWADEPSGFKWLAQKLGGATTYSALSWNVVTALKQTASIPAWTALMDGGYAEVFRNIANFDRAAARELMDAPGFAARYGADSFAQMFKDAIRDPNANPLQRFFQAGMTAVQMGDFVPGILVGTGVYKAKKLALMRQGLEERQAREEAARIAWGLVEECQQSSRLENSPAFLRRGGFLARQAAKFASSPLLQVSHEVHTLRMWAAEAKAEARRNGGGVRMMSDSEDVARWRRRFVNQLICNHVLMPVAFYGIATMFNIALGSEPPDEEEVLGDLAMQTIVGPFGRIFLLGMIFDKGGEAVARAMGGKPNVYDSTGLAAQQYIQKIVGQLGRIGGDVADADWESVRDDLLKMLGQVSAPARYAVKIGQNAAGYDPAEARRERKAEIRRERGE